MNTTLAISRRELSSFFNSPVAYIVLCAFLLVAGFLYFSSVFVGGQASLRFLFSIAPWIFMFFAPAVTMRLVAQEKKSGTMELLLTLPIEDWQVVVGKYLAALGLVAVALLLTLPYAFTISSLTAQPNTFDWGPVIGGYLGLMLMGGAFTAVGLWASALSKDQIVGAIVAFVMCLGFMLVDKVAIFFPDALAGLLQFLSVDYHFENIARGVFDTRDLLFYFSLIAIGLLMTTRTLATARR